MRLLHSCLFILLCFFSALHALEFYPKDWVRSDLHLAEFLIHHGTSEERMRTLEEILDLGCSTGKQKFVYWVIEKQTETGLYLPFTCIVDALEKIVRSGFEHLVPYLPYFLDVHALSDRKKGQLLDCAIEAGFSSTVYELQKIGCSLSKEQQNRLIELKTYLKEEPRAIVPDAINTLHYESHGGDGNQHIYQREYRICVSFALHHMQTAECDFVRLIENLGRRRRRMAVQAELQGIECYGIPTDQHMLTLYKPMYKDYGQRIHEKYLSLPFFVTAQLNGKKIYLTQINDENWLHPDGADRAAVLEKVASLCREVQTTFYSSEKTRELAYDLGKIIWWMSHAPPFLRGTPTIISVLMDAFWIYHGRTPLTKLPDLNCEALTYDDSEAFAQYMFQRLDLPSCFF